MPHLAHILLVRYAFPVVSERVIDSYLFIRHVLVGTFWFLTMILFIKELKNVEIHKLGGLSNVC